MQDTSLRSLLVGLVLLLAACATNNGLAANATNTHDFNGDGKSDILWRNTDGDVDIWLMNGFQVLSATDFANVSTDWSIVGTGDFNGDGKTDILWRNTNGDVSIWLMNGFQILSATDFANVSTDWSIVGTGDFNGDGKSDILWRNTNGDVDIWLMKGFQVLSDADFANVSTDWSIVGTGDFNGDGKTDILWRNTNGDVDIWLMNGFQILSAMDFANVSTDWSIVGTGDFNGDGNSDILWRNVNGDVDIWLMNGFQVLSDADFANVSNSWSIVGTGDFNGDGKSDILWRNSNGDVGIWLMNGFQASSAVDLGNVPNVWTVQGAASGSRTNSGLAANATNTSDFNGDGKSDIPWRNINGDVDIWLMNGFQVLSATDFANVSNSWSIAGTADFNGDGKSDILWRNANGDVDIWLMNGFQVLSATDFANVSTDWSIVGTGDFNGDGKGDILWRNTNGDVAIWFMNGTHILSATDLGNISTSWSIVGTGDFNGDGKSDILWRNANGDVDIWLMNGFQILLATDFANVSTNWSIVGTGDFNGDGKSDILWRNTNGDVDIWLMNGFQILSSADLGNISTSWSIVGTGDFNGDGRSDILWRNTNGEVDIWLMNGLQASSAMDLGNVPNVWTVQGAFAGGGSQVSQYTVAVSASPSADGTVSGGGTFSAGSSQTVTATASSGYSLVNWTVNGSVVSTSASYTFTLTGNVTLVANFTHTTAVGGSVYYLSPQGNDALDGRTTATAWQSTNKVNASHFGPGDSLMIDGGHGTIAGCLNFSASNVTSTPSATFVVGVYNGTKWALNSNCGSDGILQGAITINGVSGIVVQDGILSGNGTHTLAGIWISNMVLAGPADTIIVQRMDISDFNTTLSTANSAEVFITGFPGNGLTNIQILNNKLHGVSVTSLDDNGIWGYGNGQNITATYSGNEVYYMGGLTGRVSTGSGITCSHTKSCEVANNYIHDIGANVNQCGGATGITTFNADSSYVHDNEVHHVHATTWTSGTCDFSALDADGYSTNGLWERNYTHHNDGPAIAFGGSPPGEPWGPNTFRLNVSEEDNLQGSNGGGIWALSPTSNGYVYNNTAYRSLDVSGAFPFCISLGYNGTYSGGLIANNTCTNSVILWGGYSGGLTDDRYNQSAIKIVNNNYQLSGTPLFFWQGNSYTSLGSFQAMSGTDVNSKTLNPLFISPGGGGDCGGVLNSACPSAYRLSSGSPMVGGGANISAFGLIPPPTGYYGNPFQNSTGNNIGIDSRIPSPTGP